MLVWFSSVFLVFLSTQQGFRQPRTITFLSDLERWDGIQRARTLSKLLCLHTEMLDCSWLVSDSRHLPRSLLFLFFLPVINLPWTIFAFFFLIVMRISIWLHRNSDLVKIKRKLRCKRNGVQMQVGFPKNAYRNTRSIIQLYGYKQTNSGLFMLWEHCASRVQFQLSPLEEWIPVNQYKVFLIDHLYPVMKLFLSWCDISKPKCLKWKASWTSVVCTIIMKTPLKWISLGRMVFISPAHFKTLVKINTKARWSYSCASLWPDTLIIHSCRFFFFFTLSPALYVRQNVTRRQDINMRPGIASVQI